MKNLNRPIPSGTLVRVRTTNGGDAHAVLTRDYVPSYPATFAHVRPDGTFTPSVTVAAWRVASVEEVAA